MRKTCVDAVYELARKDERVVFIGSDLSPGLLKEMKAEFPDRYFMEGISEQSIIGMAAGMALEGYIPYVNTIATFITRRCYEQVAVDLCLHDLPVRLIANGGGLVYTPLGPTHLAIEDIAIMRALPNMSVFCASDAEEMKRFMRSTLDWPHPIYIRLAKGGDKVISREELGFTFGKAIHLREATGSKPVLLVATGVATTRALEAAEMLAADGIECDLLHMHTVKPLDTETLYALAAKAACVVTVEEHVLTGGLGSAVTDVLTLDGRRAPPIYRLGIPDNFAKHYGGQDDLMQTYGLQPPQIATKIKQILEGKAHEPLRASA